VLRTRLKTAAILLPAVMAIVIFAPPPAFTFFIGIVTGWALYECGAMVQADAVQWLGIAALGMPTLLLFCGRIIASRIETAVAFAAAFGMVLLVGSIGADSVRRLPGLVFLNALWVSALFPYFALLRNGKNGVAVLILMLLIVVASDSGAYFAGRSLGRIKLLPKVSPNKTVEGAVGGLIAALAAAWLLGNLQVPELPRRQMTVLALVGGALAQLGDLVNSAFKRIAGVKDSGWIFPGHGGLLDRTCSLVFPVTFAYYYLRS
jgi:phosphatidate cytidylyltransferase